MKEIIGNLFLTIIVGLVIVVLLFGSSTLDLFHYKTFAPKYENVKREVFENTNSYVSGMINDLSDYKREYDRTDDPDEKQQIVNYVDSHFSNFDIELIDNNTLYKFLYDVRNGNLN